MRISRKELLCGIGASVLGADASADRRPVNVLVLRPDEHNPRVCSVYGHSMVHTPNMERLARMGTVYEAAYCPSPLCMPSRSAYLSGRYVHEIQAYSNCNALPASYDTWAGVLGRQGVHTVLIGKADFTMPSARCGFSERILAGDRQPPGDRFIRRKPLAIRKGDGRIRAAGWGPRPDPHQADLRVVDAAIGWLHENGSRLDRPWVLDVNIGAPHFPHYVTQAEWDLYPNGGDMPPYGRNHPLAHHPIAEDLRRHFETDDFSDDNIRGLRRGYLGCVTFVDAQLGRLLDTLEELRLLDNTVVVYTSDHGEMLGKFGMWWKCSLYEDSVRVPLIVAGSGFGRGRRVQTPVTSLDLQATLFAATRRRRPPSWHGTPLQHIAARDTQRIAFAEYHGHGTRCSSYMVRRGPWKLLYHAEAPPQLFRLDTDPEETVDLASERLDVVRQLTGHLRAICDPDAENLRAERFIERQLASSPTSGAQR